MDDSFFKFFVCSAEPGAVVPKRAPSNHLICMRCVHRHLVVDRFSSISRLISQQNMQISGCGVGGAEMIVIGLNLKLITFPRNRPLR